MCEDFDVVHACFARARPRVRASWPAQAVHVTQLCFGIDPANYGPPQRVVWQSEGETFEFDAAAWHD